MAKTLKTHHATETIDLARRAASIANDGKAEQIVILDVQGISSITDYFVIFTGTSLNHLRALGKKIEDDFEAHDIKATHVDGQRAAGWIVYDFGNFIVHAMTNDVRRMYDLERLWGDAPHVDWESQ